MDESHPSPAGFPRLEPTARTSGGYIEITRTEGKPDGVVIAKLAELPERALLDQHALANALNVSKRTVRRMVSRNELPPPVAFAGRSTWQVGRVLAWFEARAERAAREAERLARRMNRID